MLQTVIIIEIHKINFKFASKNSQIATRKNNQTILFTWRRNYNETY